MRILAIETSCDETACAIVERTEPGLVRVVAETVASSGELHVVTGGIVPEVAAREQMRAMVPVIVQTISKAVQNPKQYLIANNQIRDWARENIEAIAVTAGPGLIGSLLVGVESAKTLALAWEKPLIPVNHLRAHVYANWLESEKLKTKNEKHQLKIQNLTSAPELPAIGLVVSGGHTDLVLMKGFGEFEMLGSTRDDAAGECFDKCARVLGLPYPGGPAIAASAAKFKMINDKLHTKLPRPLLYEDTYDFSFSGLKVAMQRERGKNEEERMKNEVAELAFELQEAVVEGLAAKAMRAVEEFKPKSFLLAGGVAANKRLRAVLNAKCQNLNVPRYVPEMKWCTDNAAMVGAAAVFEASPLPALRVKPDPGLAMVDT